MFRTRSQLPFPSAPLAPPLVVHDYTLATSSEFALESAEEVLRRGRLALARDALWQPVHEHGSICSLLHTDFVPPRIFQFAQPPPVSEIKPTPRILAEWNPADLPSLGDEILNTHALEEFQNTDLDILFVQEDRPLKRLPTEQILDESSFKRRKLDVGSLRDVIPQPHVVPSMLPAPTKKSLANSAAYSKFNMKHPPIPIPPHTLPLPDPLPYTRHAWVIPVRGKLPWRDATSASVLLDGSEPPKPPDAHNDEMEVTWTAPALAAFWSFLLDLRAKKQLGPLGLSFNVSPYYSSNSQPSYTEHSSLMMGAQPVTLENHPSTVSSVPPGPVLSSISLPLVDHIKVYHDAVDSTVLRNVLDAWAFELGVPGSSKIRLLKGARLVLVDEGLKGVIVV